MNSAIPFDGKFKQSILRIVPDGLSNFEQLLQNFKNRIPYYEHTNPQVSAIASLLYAQSPHQFNQVLANGYISKVMSEISIVDVYRYWYCLNSVHS